MQRNHQKNGFRCKRKGIILKILIYGKPSCVYCDRAKELCSLKFYEFEYKDVTEAENLTELKSKVPNVKTVPQIFIDDGLIGGYDDFKVFVEAKEHKRCLNQLM
jgi:glutaredoxin 1